MRVQASLLPHTRVSVFCARACVRSCALARGHVYMLVHTSARAFAHPYVWAHGCVYACVCQRLDACVHVFSGRSQSITFVWRRHRPRRLSSIGQWDICWYADNAYAMMAWYANNQYATMDWCGITTQRCPRSAGEELVDFRYPGEASRRLSIIMASTSWQPISYYN